MIVTVFPSRARRFLLDRLERLHDALQGLGQRLRESIAHIIGDQIGDAVRDALENALQKQQGSQPVGGAHAQDQPFGYHDRRPFHQRQERLHEGYEERGFWQDREEWARDSEPAPEQPAEPAPEQKSSRSKVLLVGAVELATWWLRRPERPSLKKVVGAGALIGLVSLVAGPLVGGALMTIGTTVLLTRMADNATQTVERLAAVPVR